MISLLLVDDEQLELDAIRSTIDFAALGIAVAGEANNIFEAKEIFARKPIDILLCDIEMPQGSGLDLLEWVRTHSPQTECIFLTCHAEFNYARQAIALGSLDYLLKPALEDELADVLRKAASKVRQASKQVADQQFSKLWLRHQPLVVERFWLDILQQKILPTLEEIRKAALAIDLPGLEEMRVLPVLIKIQAWHEPLNTRDEKLMEFALKNIGEELILRDPNNGILIDLDEQNLLALLYLDHEARPDQQQLPADLTAFIAAVNGYLKADLCCYIGTATYLNDLVTTVARLRAQDHDNVTSLNRFFRSGDKNDSAQAIVLPDMGIWMTLLERGGQERLQAAIEEYLQTLLGSTSLDARFLNQFQQDFMQAAHAYLKQKGIQAHQLFGDTQSINRYTQATQSVEKMRQWTRYIVEKMADYLEEVAKSRSVVSKVRQFIAQNIEKDLTSEEIASQVFLNPIYLTRLFKKETGLSISEYLIGERLKIARELLEKTSLPVSTIASRLGYANFSHFSRIFRKYTSLTPLDYRKQTQMKKEY